MLDEGAATRTRHQGFGEGQVVLGRLEGDAFVQQGIGDGVEAPVHEAHGAQVVLVWQVREDEIEELVGEGMEPVRRDGGSGRHGWWKCTGDGRRGIGE
ncbi:hypothetical protein B7463_g6761, partial [Scytalidium lignicola]